MHLENCLTGTSLGHWAQPENISGLPLFIPVSSWFVLVPPKTSSRFHPGYILNWNRLHPGFIPVPPKTSSWFYPIFFLCFFLMFHPGVRMQFVKPSGFILIILVVFHPVYIYIYIYLYWEGCFVHAARLRRSSPP